MNKQSNDGENKDGGGTGMAEGAWDAGKRATEKAKRVALQKDEERERGKEARIGLNKCPDKECHKYVCENYADVLA